MAYDTEKKVAIAAVTAAAHLCEQVRHEMVPDAIEKQDKSPVTIADYGAQALVCQTLATAFPNDPIVGEEDTQELASQTAQLEKVTTYIQRALPTATPSQVIDWIDRGNGSVSPRYWTLDPIDGTKGFLRGDQYAVALALIENGDLKVGALACPALTLNGHTGCLFIAVRGEGAVWMPLDGGPAQPLQVATADHPDYFRFVESVESGHGDQSQQQAIAQAVGINTASIRMDSQAKYSAVAAGQAVLYLRLPSPKSPNYREKIWDHAAGVLLVEEAGGRVSDMHGKPLDFSQAARFPDNKGVIVSNGDIHDQVLAALAQA